VLLLLASVFALPPPLTGLNVLWLVCVVLPALGVSLVGTSADKNLMKVLTGKRTQGKRRRKKIYKVYFCFVWVYLIKLIKLIN